ncbi:MAG: type 4a pilus biogenesis protein PilO [Parcubacteria group bacterium]|nr:type 4a pilus biogenesis protein PilO [Parcubacteria group bacterium]
MGKLLVPLIALAVSAGVFFGYIDPTYEKVKATKAVDIQFNQALSKSRELQEIRDTLLSRFNTFSQADLDRLVKMLPDNIDNVRLILDIDGIASKYNMRTRNVQIATNTGDSADAIRIDTGATDSVVLSFSVAGSYEDFIEFLKDLESSLRIVDVLSLKFDSTKPGDLYEFGVSIRTYWLK